ncbi:hypothetical protein HKBW3S03_00867 [Candidatus Hakubella thermalkaliphila]|uniref:Uncharacterized protein n=3 Tax=Candidatus Hakubella thermalkaliphila TaxID=2754717 RepID=A0A6V8PJH4_9ACTN|nr:hypothetical protein HKBW3S03_00867 [Candidatus Hakubella thermalkaliphila]GFP31116.1 hypothetical protein HKBW3S34_02035 [Candidatus Hakubella thermalkaliphila]GFP37263.1 hypothetical protein HKBW3S44_00943 [Candidatus Hakubella thermalkaliphila]
MPWDKERFNTLESRILATVAGRRPIVDVPYYVFTYDPGLELICLREFKDLHARLRQKGVQAECFSLAQWMIDTLEALGCLDESFAASEKSNRKMVAEDLERELAQGIVSRLTQTLAGRDVSHCALLIRAGSLFPFVHVSTLLSLIEG